MGHRVPFRDVLEHTLVGAFFTNFLPTTIGGDVARVYYLGRREGVVAATVSIVVDRVLGLMAMSAWAAVLLWWLDIPDPAFHVARQVATGLVVVIAGGLMALAAGWLGGVGARLARLPGLGWAGRAAHAVETEAAPFGRQPQLLAAGLGIALGYFALLAWAYRRYFAVSAGLDVPLAPLLAALLTMAVASSLPVTVNGIGLREQLHYLLLGVLGVSKELAVAASVIMFSLWLLVSLIGYVAWARVRLVKPPRSA